MKQLLKICMFLSFGVLFFASCKKEARCNNCDFNKPPTANAGPDQIITLPTDSIILDGSASSDPDSKINEWLWKKFSGPVSFSIADSSVAKTGVTNLEAGIYHFELKVKDAEGFSVRDTVKVTVVNTNQGNSASWTQLQPLPANEFFFAPRFWFGGDNFLMGVDDIVFAVSNKGNVWKYASGAWLKTGVFPENMTSAPVIFSVGSKIYCIGNNHCWQYNPATTQWARKNDPPNSVTAPLVINNKVYLRIAPSQMVAYDPLTDLYVHKNKHPSLGNSLLGSFVINGEGYYTGQNRQCWKYDLATDSWIRKADFATSGSVDHTSSFSLEKYGYIIGDLNGDAYNLNQPMKLWRYYPSTDKWNQTSEDYTGYGAYTIRTVSFNGIVYVGLGYNNGDSNAIDFWSYK